MPSFLPSDNLYHNHNISYFLISPDTYQKFATEKENYEALSKSPRVHLVKDETIPSSKSPKTYVKLITYMNNDNSFYLIIYVVFAMSPQLGGLGPKYQDLVIYFSLVK